MLSMAPKKWEEITVVCGSSFAFHMIATHLDTSCISATKMTQSKGHYRVLNGFIMINSILGYKVGSKIKQNK